MRSTLFLTGIALITWALCRLLVQRIKRMSQTPKIRRRLDRDYWDI